MKKRMIATIYIIALFLLTACTREQPAPAAPSASPSSADTADLTGDVVSAEDEQELDALSQSLEEEFGLEEIDELVNLEI